MKTYTSSGLMDSQRDVKERRCRLLSVLTLALALLGCNDMKPPRPYAVPFNLDQAGYTSKFEIEVLEKDVGVKLDLVFYFENQEQRDTLFERVLNLPRNPEKPASDRDNPRTGVIVPIHVSLKRGNEVIFVGRRDAKGAYSWSAGTPGYLNRNVYGTVLPKGKYQIELINIESQPVFRGYRTEIKIPGHRKV